ncbi:hypothetical protein [Thiocapsa sp.]|uniref:hypothetical protein n=1 Tax=Thiocapsa sp. TaxID=2024551 RepID=UPI002B806388|nr:hypothetical protein [Thiocapsa sp.]HSO82084.1 hypothetical protein [Thiocapsa sp.]
MIMIMFPIAINQMEIATEISVVPSIREYQVITESQRQPIPFQYSPRETASTLTQPRDHAACWSLLDELSRLAPNWDAYGAEPIAARCMANTRCVLTALPAGIPSPEITPNPNGTLTLDWETEDQALSLELGATRFSTFWESRTGTKMEEGTFDTSIPNFVAMALDSMFPDLTQTQPLCEDFAFSGGRGPGFTPAHYYG